jgi:adhesin transport system outer membrane protein
MIAARAHHFLLLALLLVGGVLLSPAVGAETLEESVRLTLSTNPEVLITVARRLSTDEALNQALGGYFPKVDLAYGRGRETRDNVTTQDTYGGEISQNRYDRSLTLNQMLFDGFSTAGEVSRNQSRVESAAHKLASTSEQTALKTAEAYLEVLRLKEIIELTRLNLEMHQRTYDQIKLRATSGVGRRSDLDQIEARLALARSNLTASEANLEVAHINYKLVVGQLPGVLVRPKVPDAGLLPRDPGDAVTQAIANNRILKSAQADVSAANAQHQTAKASLYPRFDLELGVQRNDFVNNIEGTNDDNRYAMLKFRYNIFKGGSDVARIGETRHQAYEAEEILRRAERQLEQSVRLSWNAYSSARDRLPNLRQHALSSGITREAYNKQFAIGQRTLLDLLDTENEYYTASVNFVNGQYVEQFARYRILAETGLLLDALGVPQREEAALSFR